MRVGTWNVEYADVAATNVRRRAAMRRNRADIWVLTETHDCLWPPTGNVSAAHSDQRSFYGTRVKEMSRWVSIWTRYPIIARPRLRGADRERTTIALIKTPVGQVLVYGTVLPWNGDKGRYGMNAEASGWSEHHRVIPLQIAEWKRLRSRFPRAALCVAGDLNTDLDRGGYYGTRRGIAMLRAGLRAQGLYCASAPGRLRRGLLAHPPIDHVVLPAAWSDRTSVVSAWEGRNGKPRMSDHSGLVVEIRGKPDGPGRQPFANSGLLR